MKSGESLIALNNDVSNIIVSTASTVPSTTTVPSTITGPEETAVSPETTTSESPATTQRLHPVEIITAGIVDIISATQVTVPLSIQESNDANSTLISQLEIITSTIPESDEANITEATRRVFKKYSPAKEDNLREDDLKFLNSHAQLRQHDFVDTETDPEGDKRS
ncbi:hypothetical protein COOONC_04348 [Cooperia oncophora]